MTDPPSVTQERSARTVETKGNAGNHERPDGLRGRLVRTARISAASVASVALILAGGLVMALPLLLSLDIAPKDLAMLSIGVVCVFAGLSLAIVSAAWRSVGTERGGEGSGK